MCAQAQLHVFQDLFIAHTLAHWGMQLSQPHRVDLKIYSMATAQPIAIKAVSTHIPGCISQPSGKLTQHVLCTVSDTVCELFTSYLQIQVIYFGMADTQRDRRNILATHCSLIL